MATLKRTEPLAIRSVRPNAGVQAAYRARLDKMIKAMQKSLVHWLEAQYRATPPMALDGPDGSIERGNAATALNQRMEQLARRWQDAFDDAAPKLAKWFAQNAMDRSDLQMQAILRDAGFTVKFRFTDSARTAYNAVVNENVGLIKSIAQQHLGDVQGMVMRSVSTGRDIGALSNDLQARYGITKRRAAFIARDQNNKATAVINRVRQKEIGVTQARWRHSGGGKHPRPDHLAAGHADGGRGLIYDVDKGAYIGGKWIWPGTEPNCRCTAQSIIPGFDS